MNPSSVAPQAYTKSELTKAYQWLMEQSTQIKEMANSPDSLMGLYRKAQIYGTSSILPTESKSSTEFKSELKDLASQLGSFGKMGTAEVSPDYSSSVKYNASKGMPPWVHSTQSLRQDTSSANSERPSPCRTSQQQEFKIPTRASIEENPRNRPSKSMEGYEGFLSNLPAEIEQHQPKNYESDELDANSRAMINEIRRRLNLSSDKEALRMMISIAYERLKNLF